MNIIYNCDQITSSQIEGAIEGLAEELNNVYNGDGERKQPLIIVSVLKGSFIFTADLVRKLNFPCQIEFIKLSSYDGDHSTGNVQVTDMLPSLNKRDVLILEDIIDTGYSLDYLFNYINKHHKPNSVLCAVLLNKKKARIANIEPDYYCFEIDNAFVAGYGLDYNEMYRNQDYIGVVGNEIS